METSATQKGFRSTVVSRMAALGFIFWTTGAASASGALSMQFDHAFSGTAPSTSAPWLYASLEQSGANVVKVTLDLPGTLPAGTFLDWFGLNYNPNANASALTISGSGISSLISVNQSVNNNTGSKLKADGDGYYDIVLNFPSQNANRLTRGESYSFTIAGPAGGNITPASFNFLSEKGGSAGQWLAAVHLAGYGTSSWLSGTLVSVPETNFGFAGGMLLLICSAWQLGHRKTTNKKA